MRGKFLGSKPCDEIEGRSKHLVELDNGKYSILYGEEGLQFSVGEVFHDEAGYFQSESISPLSIDYLPAMTKEAAEIEFNKE